jgi:enoyl-CoA hydratase/carnithine racemase
MDKDCRVIVLTGEGKSFCAGFNLNAGGNTYYDWMSWGN